MHPLNFFFDEINRDYWGMPTRELREQRERHQRELSRAAEAAQARQERSALSVSEKAGGGDAEPSGDHRGSADRRGHGKEPRHAEVANREIGAEQQQAGSQHQRGRCEEAGLALGKANGEEGRRVSEQHGRDRPGMAAAMRGGRRRRDAGGPGEPCKGDQQAVEHELPSP